MPKKKEVYLTTDQLLERLPFTRQWMYVLIQKGFFPKPVKVGIRKVVWVESEIDKWFEQRKKER